MATKIVDIADEIHRELGNPTDLSIPPISYWLSTNLGQLNNLLNLTLTLDEDDLEFSTDLDGEQKVILKNCILFTITIPKFELRWVLQARTLLLRLALTGQGFVK